MMTNYRNAKFLADGCIDCEIEHPKYGWIPFTLNPNDSDAGIDAAALFDKITEDGGAAPYVPPTAQEVRELALLRVTDQIKAERGRRTQAGGYKVAGRWFHSDQFSRGQQLGLALLGVGIPAGLQWKTMDGSFVTMTQALAGQILAAGAASDAAIFAHAEQLIAQAQAAPDPSTIDPLAGWPKIYGE